MRYPFFSSLTLILFAKHPPLLQITGQLLKKDLATKLIEQENSPLKDFVANASRCYGSAVKLELNNYLLDQGETCPAVKHASASEKETLAFFKGQINHHLPITLHRKQGVDYGASTDQNLSPIEYSLAIPYLANNSPDPRSIYSELEAINCSIQMMLLKGISEPLLKAQIRQWQSLARLELFQSPNLNHIDNTPTARGFALLAPKLRLTLGQIHVDDPAEMAEMHKHLKNNRALINTLLREKTFKVNLSGCIHSPE